MAREHNKKTHMAESEAQIQKRRACTAAWYARNKERVAEYQKSYRQANRQKKASQLTEWKKKNPERYKELLRRNFEKNKSRYRARYSAYAANKLQATPKWANAFFIAEIYDLAALRTEYLGIPHQVDHIVPLRSKLVCGLHCEANLRVIPADENKKKGNRIWPEMPAN